MAEERSVMDRESRLELIRGIIATMHVSSQEELLSILLDRGCVVTQGALSKDLKKLGVVKVSDESGSYYDIKKHSSGYSDHSVVSVVFSNNIVVVKTLPGYANAVCAKIDGMKISGVAGTIAGDDTIFAVLTENADHDEFSGRLRENFVF